MKLFRFLFLSLCLCLATTSCIQDEAPNVEASIDECEVVGMTAVDIDHDAKIVRIDVSHNIDLHRVKIDFTLPAGATIAASQSIEGDVPEQGIYNFSTTEASDAYFARQFTVTAEDASHKATFEVRLRLSGTTVELFSFEQVETHTTSAGEQTYHTFTEPGGMRWASGNPGFALTGMGSAAETYPTYQITDGYAGNCVRMVTRSTGDFGAAVKMYMASGNLFMGTFSTLSALTSPLKATKFGTVFYRKPLRLKGHYRYRAGEVFVEQNVVNASKRDVFDIYAIFYEATQSNFTLTGENAFTDPTLVRLARIDAPQQTETDEWQSFDIEFNTINDKTIDEQKLAAGQYKLAVVFASSKEGDRFNGAVGSTLDVDEVELVCE